MYRYDQGLPYDSEKQTINEKLQTQGMDTDLFEDVVELTGYAYYKWDEKEEEGYSDNTNIFANSGVIKLSRKRKSALCPADSASGWESRRPSWAILIS